MSELSSEHQGTIYITREDQGRIAFVELHAPWRGNSLDNSMLKALRTSLLFFLEDDELPRCIVLKGAGEKHFSTGYNLKELLSEVEAEIPITNADDHPLERAVRTIDRFPCPTIAMIQGHAFGAGCELALNCDLRIASERAVFCMPPAKLGILYSLSGMRRLTEIVGLPTAKEMLLTAQPVEAARALQIGLVNHCVPHEQLEAKTLEIARAIAQNAPLSVRHTKASMNRYVRAPDSLRESERLEFQAMRRQCFYSEDFRRAVQAFLAKDEVEFKGQ